MDPTKLSALVDEQSTNPLGDMPEMEPGEGETEEDDAGADMGARGEELLDSMGEFGQDLRDTADLLVENAADIGDDLSSEEIGPETLEAVEDVADGMPDLLQEGFSENIPGKERADLDAIGAALTMAVETDESGMDEYSEEEAVRVGGLLQGLGECCSGDSDDDEDEEDEDEGDDEPPEDDLEAPEDEAL